MAHGAVVAAGENLSRMIRQSREGEDGLAVALQFLVRLEAGLGGGFLGDLGLVGFHLGGVGDFLGIDNRLGGGDGVGLGLGVGGLGGGEGLGLVGGGLHGCGLGGLGLG